MGSFTDVFGGNVIYPAGQTYLTLTFAVDQQLQWPIEQAIAGVPVVASIMDLDATLPGLNVDLPDARQVSNGIQSVFTNFGANTITVRDADGGAIVSLDSGQSWVAYLTDNTTNAGSWRIFQLGATVSVANASALAGAGLKAIATTLNQTIPPTSTSISPVNLVDADRAMLTIWTGGLGVLNLPTAASVGADWFTIVRNSGSGDLTITPPSGLINGFATLVLSPEASTFIVTDGVNWFTVGLGLTASSIFDFIQITVAGSGDYTLSGSELNRIAYRFNGLLTNDRTIIVPTTVQQYWVDNSTTGAFSLFVKTLAQVTPVEVFQGGRQILYCDGADVVDGDTSQFPVPLPILFGGTGATTAPAALVNLAALPIIVDLPSVAPAVGDFIAFQDIDDADNNKRATIGDIVAQAGITIEEEGTPLATLANTLDFVGAGVVASGVGATKTITIPFGNPMVASLDGDGFDLDDMGVMYMRERAAAKGDIAGQGQLWVSNVPNPNTLHYTDEIGTDIDVTRELWHNGVLRAQASLGAVNFPNTAIVVDSNMYELEGAAAGVDIPTYGQFWVRNDATQTPMFTADDGTDFVLNASGGGGQSGAKAFRTSNSPVLITDVPTIISWTAESYDTDNFHSTISNQSRLTIPAGVSIVRLKGSMSFSSFLSGGKKAYFTKGGSTLPNQIDSFSPFLVSQECVISGGVGQNGVVQVMSGEINVSPGDFFEFVAESLNQGGVVIQPGSWFEIEVIA